ncbi:MAG: ATP-binding cassette domain-containing protein [Clostridiaceae bacterium]|nr:ATP-binding cassette domain-containing protein [Clostridiaceae bacterium]
MNHFSGKPAVSVDNLSFTYPDQKVKALDGLTFEIPAGSFVLLAGPGGSGKTTLLRALKKELQPAGLYEGRIDLEGTSGFVMQDPANQIVMDQVWHELAFGLENLGLAAGTIERRIAEIAHFFGIESWIDRPVSELSGGEMQILNLASSLVMNPDTLILDEPTARLDPVSISHFLDMLKRVHQETGRTLIMSEHRMADVLSIADRVIYLDEGRIGFDGSPDGFAGYLLDGSRPFQVALPAATLIVRRLEAAVSGTGPESRLLDVPAARQRLKELKSDIRIEPPGSDTELPADTVLEARDLEFRYKSHLPWVLKGLSLTIHRGTIHAIVGGNGSGKSTLLHLLSGVLDPGRGWIRRQEGLRTGLLTQHTKALFSADSLFDELMELSALGGYGREEVLEMIRKLDLEALSERHPYDLSGGETQKAALAKLLLLSPDILLLDEPVKGMDTASKIELGHWFKTLRDQGKTLVLVTHDLNFSAQVADRCSLLFDGRMVVTEAVRPFFQGNTFYTTDYGRVAAGILPGIVTQADLGRLHGSQDESPS